MRLATASAIDTALGVAPNEYVKRIDLRCTAFAPILVISLRVGNHPAITPIVLYNTPIQYQTQSSAHRNGYCSGLVLWRPC